MGAFLASAAVQWWLRRIWDWGGMLAGWLGALLAFYGMMTPDLQHTFLTLLQGKWGEVSLASAGGFIVWAFSQWRSYRATVRPQIVTSDGKVAELRELPPGNANAVQEFAATAIQGRKQTVIERLLKLKIGG